MRIKRAFLTISFCAVTMFMSAQIWYVSPSGNNGGGQSWATAFNSIQQAINHAGTNDQIWVAAGTYREYIRVDAPHLQGLEIYGGFAGWENQIYQRDWRNNLTIIDGNTLGGMSPDRCVEIGVDYCRLDGFMIRNGQDPLMLIPSPGLCGGILVDANYSGRPKIVGTV